MNANACVLIVDDEPNVRLVLRTALESAGYRIVEAADGIDALERLREHRMDVVLMDLRMPRLDGMATLSRMRERGDLTPVVMLTAHGSIPDAVSAMRLGAIDFLTKPITPAELRTSVAEVLGRSEVRNTAATPGPSTAPSRSFGFDLVRAKRALNRGEFAEAERLLREILDGSPGSIETHELLDRLLTLKEREAEGTFPLLREWFPSG